MYCSVDKTSGMKPVDEDNIWHCCALLITSRCAPQAFAQAYRTMLKVHCHLSKCGDSKVLFEVVRKLLQSFWQFVCFVLMQSCILPVLACNHY